MRGRGVGVSTDGLSLRGIEVVRLGVGEVLAESAKSFP
jgi:hypothetical protein